jgi:hypothetical protein
MYKLSDVQLPQQKHKNKRKPFLAGQEMPQYVGYDQMDTTHSSLNKECPSLLAILEKYRQNTDY